MGQTLFYLSVHPESYLVLDALFSHLEGVTFAQLAQCCELDSPVLRSLLTHLQQYSLIESFPTPKRSRGWRIPAKSHSQVAGILTRRGLMRSVKTVSAGA